MNITPVEQIPTAIDLAVNMRAHLLQLRTTFTKPFLVIIYEHRSLLRPTYALSQPAANFNLATVRGHVLPSFQPHLNYFNNTKVKIPKEELGNIANHICNKLHTQLIRFDKIWCVCVGTTNSTNDYWVYDFKDTYSSLFEQYKKTRVEVFGNYQV
jgi:hypothetical protein